MNQRKTVDFLSSVELTGILADVADLADDAQIAVTVTYKDFQSTSRTPSTGAYTSTYTDYTIRAVRSEISAREVQVGAGLYQVGDVAFYFAQSDLPGITPLREDRMVLGSDTYEVLSWRGDALSAFWRIIARRVK